MPFAITLRFDPKTEQIIGRMWQALAEAGIDDDRNTLGYPAHITLAIYPDGTPAEPLRSAVDRLGGIWGTLPMALAGFGVFPGPTSIVWAAPVVTAALLSCQAELLAALPKLPVHAHYQRDRWVPHVTLTGSLPTPEPALAALRPLWRPIAGRLERLDLVRFRPVQVMGSHVLDR